MGANKQVLTISLSWTAAQKIWEIYSISNQDRGGVGIPLRRRSSRPSL